MCDALNVALQGALNDLVKGDLDPDERVGLVAVVMYVCINELHTLIGERMATSLLNRVVKDPDQLRHFTLPTVDPGKKSEPVVH